MVSIETDVAEMRAEVRTLGREMGEVRTDTAANTKALAAYKAEVERRFKNGGLKRKATLVMLWLASAGGLGLLLDRLFS